MHAVVIVAQFLYRPRVFASSVHLLVISMPWLLPLGHLLMGHDDWILETQ